jgi:predicted adenylyl cyclase CyaB
MARNIEIKARVSNIEILAEKVARLADHGPVEIFQDDTFFTCPNGRMKLRAFSDTAGELIFYQRPNQSGPKESNYIISRVTELVKLKEVLTKGYGQVGHVRKHRTLFIIGKTRIHLDRVDELGDFLELEVVLTENEPAEVGVSTANELLSQLGISPDQLIEGAYVDLINDSTKSSIIMRDGS